MVDESARNLAQDVVAPCRLCNSQPIVPEHPRASGFGAFASPIQENGRVRALSWQYCPNGIFQSGIKSQSLYSNGPTRTTCCLGFGDSGSKGRAQIVLRRGA